MSGASVASAIARPVPPFIILNRAGLFGARRSYRCRRRRRCLGCVGLRAACSGRSGCRRDCRMWIRRERVRRRQSINPDGPDLRCPSAKPSRLSLAHRLAALPPRRSVRRAPDHPRPRWRPDERHGQRRAGEKRTVADGANPAVRALALAEARSGTCSSPERPPPPRAGCLHRSFIRTTRPIRTLAARYRPRPPRCERLRCSDAGLDRAEGLERSVVTSGTVWRVRPDGLTPARVRVESASGVTTFRLDPRSCVSTATWTPQALVLTRRLRMALRGSTGWRSPPRCRLRRVVAGIRYTHRRAPHIATWPVVDHSVAHRCGCVTVVALASALSAWRKR